MTERGSGDGLLERALAAVADAYSTPAQAHRAATEVLNEVLADARGDPEATAVAQRALGMSAAALGDLGGGVRHLRRSLRVAETAGLVARAAEARGSLAYVLLLTGRSAEAIHQLDVAQASPVGGLVAARLAMQRGLVLSELRHLDAADAALSEALAVLTAAGGDPLLEADTRNNRAIVHLGGAGWVRAREDLRIAEELYERTGRRGRTALVFHNRGVGESLHGDVPAALAAFDEAAARYRAAGMSSGLLEVDRAEALLGTGLIAEARSAAEAAVSQFAAQRNAVDLVQARLLLAEAALAEGDHETARDQAERARRAALRQGRQGWATLGGYLRLRALEAGEQSPALILATGERVAGELAAAGWQVHSMDCRLVVARTAVRQGRRDLAHRVLSEVAPARRSRPAGVRARAWHATALLRWADGDRRGARVAVRAGLRVLDTFRASLGATELRTQVSSHADGLARLGLRLALESGRAWAVLVAAERVRASSVWLRPVRPPDDEAMAADLAELRRLDSDRRSGVLEPHAGRARQVALEAQIRDRARRVPGAPTPGPAAAVAEPGRALPRLGALSSTLGPATLVEYVEVDGLVHAALVQEGRCSVRQLASLETTAAAVDALRSGLLSLAHGAGGPTLLDHVRGTAAALDRTLVRPLELPDATPLVLVPTGALTRLPWPALPSLSTRAVSVTPSAALWHRAATARVSSRGRPLGVVLAHGPGLPGAAAEIATLATAYAHWAGPVDRLRVLAGGDARVAAVLESIDGSGLAHIAAHGTFRSDNPMFSALLLADGLLTVHDLETLGETPREVVLAACDAGLGRVQRGDEVLGIATALLGMGTTALVAPVVPVADAASLQFMLDYHDRRRSGLEPAAALASSRVELGVRLGARPATELDPLERAALAASWGYVCLGAG